MSEDNGHDCDGGFQKQSPPAAALPLHFLNNLAHMKPINYVLDALIWYFVLLLAAPIGAVGIVLRTFYRLFMLILRSLGMGIIKPSNTPDKTLALFITGADSGFGLALAKELLQEGFVVFCGCLCKESVEAFANEKLAIPMIMDVTKDEDVELASKKVQDWLSEGNDRVLHALVNNAGIGTPGLLDWVAVEELQKMMDVNCLGLIRTTKAFLPHFKSQASKGTYSNARIVNMVSVAGMMSGGMFTLGYEVSKHAAEVVSTNLRQEMKAFGVKVIVINPSFHKTNMTGTMTSNLEAKWKSLPAEKRKEYGGDDYIEMVSDTSKVAASVVNWDWENVVDAMKKSIVWTNPPPKFLVGSDAKYLFMLVRMLPTWFGSRMQANNFFRLTRAIRKAKQQQDSKKQD